MLLSNMFLRAERSKLFNPSQELANRFIELFFVKTNQNRTTIHRTNRSIQDSSN